MRLPPFLSLCLTLSLAANFAQARLPANNATPGGVAVVRLEVAAPPLRVTFGSRRVITANLDGHWHAIVGLANDTVPGDYLLTVTAHGQTTSTQNFRVMPASAARRIMHLPAALSKLSFASAAPQDARRLNADLWQFDARPDFVFTPVVDAARLLPFGLLVNERSAEHYIEHAGVTYFAAAGAIARAPAAGVVHQIRRTKAEGTVIYLNHGQGLASVLSHLGISTLKRGQSIQAGQPLGVVEPVFKRRNGRVHWQLLLNGNLLDPLQFAPSR